MRHRRRPAWRSAPEHSQPLRMLGPVRSITGADVLRLTLHSASHCSIQGPHTGVIMNSLCLFPRVFCLLDFSFGFEICVLCVEYHSQKETHRHLRKRQKQSKEIMIIKPRMLGGPLLGASLLCMRDSLLRWPQKTPDRRRRSVS